MIVRILGYPFLTVGGLAAVMVFGLCSSSRAAEATGLYWTIGLNSGLSSN